MLTKFNAHIDQQLPFLREKRLLLACSGGMDSVVLGHLARASGLDLVLAHCNFGLRGSESDGDEDFVRNLAGEWGIPFLAKGFDTVAHADQKRISIQMAARELRYGWFDQVLEEQALDFVLTAHHGDDDLETFLINLSRGTGIEGLMGIPMVNGRVVRPLLIFSTEELRLHAVREKLLWREDSSNLDHKYLRNQIRHTVVPKLRELHPAFLQNFRRTQSNLKQAHGLMDHHIRQTGDRLFVDQGDALWISIVELQGLRPLGAYLYGLFHPYGFKDAGELQQLMGAMSGKFLLSGTHRLLKDRENLILSPLGAATKEWHSVPDMGEPQGLPIGLHMERVESIGDLRKDCIYLDKEKLNFPLVLRKWNNGDYFYPFGMEGRKKLAKFFKDEKVDVDSKGKQWLLCSGDDIVWVVGRRADRRFGVDPSTREIIKITLDS